MGRGVMLREGWRQEGAVPVGGLGRGGRDTLGASLSDEGPEGTEQV